MTDQQPTNLGARGKAFWTEIASKFSLRADERRILEDACREMDLIERMDRELRSAELTIDGSRGQGVVNDLVKEIRQHRALLARLLAALKLPDELAQGESRSSSARDAAISRWGKRGA